MAEKRTVGVLNEAWDAHKRKARQLVDAMTLEECASQLLFRSVAIPRLNISEYNWWNEALHGVARAGMATVFPEPIGLAATFDPSLIHRVAKAISDEGRAKYHAYRAQGDRGIYKGITFWSPNVNIFRDPRWGRGQETYGEDPFLTSCLGAAFVRGIQGEDSTYLKCAACAKHFAVHSGPESLRHSFNAIASLQDLTETYLPAFKALVDCGVAGIMGAYNRTNGEPCCGSPTLLRSLLIDTWGFDGYITSDCWAIADFHLYHKVTSSETESIALALENGCVLNCGSIYSHLKEAYQEGLVSESMIRDAAEKVLAIRCALGMFEEHIPFDDIEYTVVDCEQHRRLNLEVARKSLVLLRNDGLLPLRIQHVKHLAVVGPNANSIRALEGNYHGTANQYHTVLESIRTSFSDARVTYSVGAHLHDDKLEDPGYVGDRLGEVKTHIAMADAVILVVGLDESIESEDKGKGKPGFSGDKEDLLLPKSQRLLVETVMAQGKPVIIICMSGSALDLEKGNCANAIIQAWYPGAMGGVAIADLICGRFSPSGRLPVTFYRNSNELPPFEDYSMDNRTYKFFSGEPLYPFGFGLSYTRFEYSGMVLEQDTLNPGEDLHGNLTIANVGDYDGDEIVQFYLRDLDATVRIPHHALCGMQRVSLKRGEHKMIDFTIAGCMFQVTDTDGFTRYERGEFMLFAGPGQPDRYSTVLRHQACQSVRLRLL